MMLHLWDLLEMIKESRERAGGGEHRGEHHHAMQDVEKEMLAWEGRNASVRGAPQETPPKIALVALSDACFYKQKEQWVVSGALEELRQRTQVTNTSAGMGQQLLPSVLNPSQVRFALSASPHPC